MSDDFRSKFRIFSERMVGVAPRCTNEESTKLFLILPFLNFLGYDDRNPDEVSPEHSADFAEKFKNRVDFAILRGGVPVIAVECKSLGTALKDERGQLRGYFNAVQTVKMGVITDGLIYEFYADSDEPNLMDQTAFLSIDLREIAKGKMEDSVDEGLRSLHKAAFDPENIGAEAKRKLIFQNLVQQITKLAEEPTEALVRTLLQNVGVSHVRTKALDEYRDLVRNAFREFVNVRILQRLDLPTKEKDGDKSIPPVAVAAAEPPPKDEATGAIDGIKKEVFDYVRMRLAFLIREEDLFVEIDKIDFHDYKGKFVVFYKRERAGRLFDFFDGRSRKYSFDFGPSAGGEITTDRLADIDEALLAAFTRRVKDANSVAKRGGTPRAG